uniref:tRNA wybutosine-synthesizing protein 3 homolog n=1 Tax=Hucho hucho TaxID=62062 RepID=A0A4W5M858_9TELE
MENTFIQWKKQSSYYASHSYNGESSYLCGVCLFIIYPSQVSDTPDVQKLNCPCFVLHVQCRQLEHAQLLHSLAINSGFRNSGLTVDKKGKIITAVRGTHGLDVPLSHKGQVLVKEDYIYFLVEVANQKMEENVKQIERFYEWLQSALQPAEPQSPSRQEMEEKSVYKQQRKRGQTDV